MFGQSVTFTATVSSTTASGIDGGTVTFQDGGTSIGTGTVSSGTATYTTSATQLPAGTDTITAVYGADTNFSGSTSATFPQAVSQASTTTTVTSSGNGTSVYGESVTFTATVTNSSGGSSATPAGTVTFQDNSISIGTGTVSSGTATYTPSAAQLPVGTHTITAVYGNDTNFAGSTGTLAGGQTVTQASTTTTLTANVADNTSQYGQSVTFTATVTPQNGGTPTGNVTFIAVDSENDPSIALGTSTLSAGQATLTYSFTTGVLDDYFITATYGGDGGNFAGSANTPPLDIYVSPASTTTTVTSSTGGTSVFGQNVTFTATVNTVDPSSGTLTGTVGFKEAGSLHRVTLVNGQATYASTSFTVGNHLITVNYYGDSNNSSSNPAFGTTFTQTVLKSSSATALTSSPSNPIGFGSPVTFTATVSAAGAGVGTPTGTVTFSDGSNSLGTCTLSGTTPDIATYTTTQLAAGTHTIKAVYSSDANFNASTSTTLTQTVTAMGTTTTVTSAPNTSVFGQSVTFTATVTATGFDRGGTVTFSDGSTSLGTSTLNGSGQATFTALSSVITTVATHTITASYGGDANFATSSNSVLQTVNQASTTTTISSSSSNPSVFGQSCDVHGDGERRRCGRGHADRNGHLRGRQQLHRHGQPQRRHAGHGHVHDQHPCGIDFTFDHGGLQRRQQFHYQHLGEHRAADGQPGQHDDDGDFVYRRRHVGLRPERDVHGDGQGSSSRGRRRAAW